MYSATQSNIDIYIIYIYIIYVCVAVEYRGYGANKEGIQYRTGREGNSIPAIFVRVNAQTGRGDYHGERTNPIPELGAGQGPPLREL